MSKANEGLFFNMNDEIVSFAESNRLLLIYFFGSRTKEEDITFKSDYDFAFLLDVIIRDSSNSNYFKGSLIAQMERTFKISPIDIVILNNAPPILSYEIIKTGSLIYNKKDEIRTEFEAKAIRNYLDYKYYSERFNSIYIDSLRVNGVL